MLPSNSLRIKETHLSAEKREKTKLGVDNTFDNSKGSQSSFTPENEAHESIFQCSLQTTMDNSCRSIELLLSKPSQTRQTTIVF